MASNLEKYNQTGQEQHLGVHKPEDMAPDLIKFYHNGLPPTFSTGFKSLDQYYTIRPGDVTIITGTPGSGKSTWLDQVLIHTMKAYNWRHGMFTPENEPYELHVASLAEKLIGAPFSKGKTPRMTERDLKDALSIINTHFRYVRPKRLTLNDVLEGLKWCAYMGMQTGTIDPWADVDKERSSYQSETDYINKFLTEVRSLARSTKMHIFVVAHPKMQQKLNDGNYAVVDGYGISGSAHWNNKADAILSMWRDFLIDGRSVMHVKKIRRRDVGRITTEEGVEFGFDRVTGIYRETHGTLRSKD